MSAIASKVDPSKLQGAGAAAKSAEKAAAAGAGAASPKAKADAKAKAEPKEKGKKGAPPAKPADRPLDDFSRFNIVVGKIVEVWPHESAEKLYCEKIDLGEPSGPRTIAS